MDPGWPHRALSDMPIGTYRTRAEGVLGMSRKNAAWGRKHLEAVYGKWCWICGRTDVRLEYDHKAPIVRTNYCGPHRAGGALHLWRRLKRGRDNPFNIQPLCKEYHAAKSLGDFV